MFVVQTMFRQSSLTKSISFLPRKYSKNIPSSFSLVSSKSSSIQVRGNADVTRQYGFNAFSHVNTLGRSHAFSSGISQETSNLRRSFIGERVQSIVCGPLSKSYSVKVEPEKVCN